MLCLRNARAFPLLPAALASVPFGFVLVRVRVLYLHLWHVSARSRRLYLAYSLRTSRRGLSAKCVSRPRYTRHFSGLFFAPVGHRLNVLVRRRAPATLSIACPLSCCICPIMDYGSRRRMVRPESGRNSTQFSYSSRSLGLEIRRSRISEGIKRMFMGIFSC